MPDQDLNATRGAGDHVSAQRLAIFWIVADPVRHLAHLDGLARQRAGLRPREGGALRVCNSQKYSPETILPSRRHRIDRCAGGAQEIRDFLGGVGQGTSAGQAPGEATGFGSRLRSSRRFGSVGCSGVECLKIDCREMDQDGKDADDQLENSGELRSQRKLGYFFGLARR